MAQMLGRALAKRRHRILKMAKGEIREARGSKKAPPPPLGTSAANKLAHAKRVKNYVEKDIAAAAARRKDARYIKKLDEYFGDLGSPRKKEYVTLDQVALDRVKRRPKKKKLNQKGTGVRTHAPSTKRSEPSQKKYKGIY